jgi:hypothetical protein
MKHRMAAPQPLKKTHRAALACIAVALVLYVFAGSELAAGGFGLLGVFFEMMAWRKVLRP